MKNSDATERGDPIYVVVQDLDDIVGCLIVVLTQQNLADDKGQVSPNDSLHTSQDSGFEIFDIDFHEV